MATDVKKTLEAAAELLTKIEKQESNRREVRQLAVVLSTVVFLAKEQDERLGVIEATLIRIQDKMR